MTNSTSTIFSPAIDFNSAQITTTKGTIHKQMVHKLAKPYMKEIERVCREIVEDESKNKKPKVHFLLCDKDQALHYEVNCVGSEESEYHKDCFVCAVENRWIRTDYSDFDRQYFRDMSVFTRAVLQMTKSPLLFVVVDGYMCHCVLDLPKSSPKGFGSMR